jgi:hypothetical protein
MRGLGFQFLRGAQIDVGVGFAVFHFFAAHNRVKKVAQLVTL